MHWGTSLWYFFHTYIEKINSDFFKNNKDIIIGHFTSCLAILPCPMCQIHAKNNLKKFNIKLINNKEDFKQFLMTFHNMVNEQLKKPKFNEYELNKLYSKGNFNRIIINVMTNFTKNLHLSKNLNDSMLRKITMNNILSFIDLNKKEFSW
mgnify:CR=1 FL=1|jgi:hypothetical protein